MCKVIMVVDDEVEMLSLLELILKRQGFAVMKAQDASQALHLSKSLIPNLFIVDVMMPGMSGIELCRRIRGFPHIANVPVIMFSAHNDVKNKDSSFRAGADAFLTKASLHNGLIDKIHKLLDVNSSHTYT